MKKTIPFLAAAILVSSCNAGKASQAEETISRGIRDAVSSEVTRVVFNQHPVLVDSVTFRQELENRKKIFEKKIELNWRYYEGFSSRNNRKRADEKLDAIKKDQATLAALQALEAIIKDTLDHIAYYDYEFEALAKTRDNDVLIAPGYACITSDGIILTLTSDPKARHRNIGGVIPGYMEAIKGNSEEEL